MTTTVVERRGLQCRQECPVCEALLADEAITLGRWRLFEDAGQVGYERTVSMACPACGHGASRLERRVIE